MTSIDLMIPNQQIHCAIFDMSFHFHSKMRFDFHLKEFWNIGWIESYFNIS